MNLSTQSSTFRFSSLASVSSCFVPPCPRTTHNHHHAVNIISAVHRHPLHTFSMFAEDNELAGAEDGDFAILGMHTNEDIDNPEDTKSTKLNQVYNTGTTIGSQGVGNMLFNEQLLKSGRMDLGLGSTERYRDFRGNDIIPKVDPSVKEWMLEVLPSLEQSDVQAYAEGLTNIGFNPTTLTSLREMTYDDLDFMKVLHRRCVYKEITGKEHPFEPYDAGLRALSRGERNCCSI